MRVMDVSEFTFVSGGADNSGAGVVNTTLAVPDGNTVTTRGIYDSYSGWQSGGVGAAIGSALYSIGKSLGWWG